MTTPRRASTIKALDIAGSLREVLAYNNMLPVNAPAVLVSNADRKFDDEGHLQDELTRRFVRK